MLLDGLWKCTALIRVNGINTSSFAGKVGKQQAKEIMKEAGNLLVIVQVTRAFNVVFQTIIIIKERHAAARQKLIAVGRTRRTHKEHNLLR